jgi:hypothetical protein
MIVLVLTQVAVVPSEYNRVPVGPNGINVVLLVAAWIGMDPAAPPAIFCVVIALAAALPEYPI